MPSIEKRGPQSWRLVVEGGVDANGKRVQERKTVRIQDESVLQSKKATQAYLQAQLAVFRAQVESGQYIRPDRTTFADFVALWRENYAESNLGAYTRRNYIYTIDQHLIPTFGHLEMSKIKTMHVVAFFTKLRSPEGRTRGADKPLSANTQLNVYKALKSILDAAVRWRVVSVNPIEGVERPHPDKTEKRELRDKKKSYSRAESVALIEALYQEPVGWRLYFLGVLLGGFRRGEMLGLRWEDVDTAKGGLHIRRQISFAEDGSTTEAELKTEESEAFVPMPHFYMEELAQFRREWVRDRLAAGTQWAAGETQYVFHGGNGLPYYPNTPSMQWRRLLARHGLPRIRLHDLRHTTATLLREEGVDLKSIQERLRHTRLATTADIYTHESDAVSRDAADRLETLDPRRSHSKI